MVIVITSLRAAIPSSYVTKTINARDAMITPSRNAPATGELRMRGISGPLIATKTNAGRKMPTVAITAPTGPASRKPMNVAVVKTGPGVTWPIAIASKSWASVIQCKFATRSVRRNASRT